MLLAACAFEVMIWRATEGVKNSLTSSSFDTVPTRGEYSGPESSRYDRRSSDASFPTAPRPGTHLDSGLHVVDSNFSERSFRDDRSYREQSFREHRQPTSRSYGNSYLNTDSSMTAEAPICTSRPITT